MKQNDFILGAALDPARQGIPYSGLSGYEDGNCTNLWNQTYNRALLCQNMEFVELEMLVPKHIVSGSEVLYGPVGFTTRNFRTIGTGALEGEDSVTYFADALINPHNI